MDADADFVIWKTEFFADGKGGEGIVNIEFTWNLSFDFYITTCIFYAGSGEIYRCGTEICWVFYTIESIILFRGTAIDGFFKYAVARVIAVDDAVLCFFEQFGFGGDVAVKSLVVVKMFMGNVGHDGNFYGDAEGAKLREGMRSGF